MNHTSMTDNWPSISVIIPCFNAASTIRETLESVRAQSFEAWEAIVVDNGCTDATMEIVAELAALDSRIRISVCEKKGPSAARNFAAFTSARGDYLAFLDSDDIWTPDKLAVSHECLARNNSVDAVFAKISFFRLTPDQPETFSTIHSEKLDPVELLRENPVCTMSNLVIWSSLFRNLNGFDENIVHNEDVEFLVRALAAGAHIKSINKHLVCYRTSVSGLSTNLHQMRIGWQKAIDALRATPYRLSARDLAAADAGNLRYLARRALRTDAPRFEALNFAIRGVLRSPSSFFSPMKRGLLTLAGAIAAPLLPKSVRTRAFSG